MYDDRVGSSNKCANYFYSKISFVTLFISLIMLYEELDVLKIRD
jgi:hypothetical protein